MYHIKIKKNYKRRYLVLNLFLQPTGLPSLCPTTKTLKMSILGTIYQKNKRISMKSFERRKLIFANVATPQCQEIITRVGKKVFKWTSNLFFLPQQQISFLRSRAEDENLPKARKKGDETLQAPFHPQSNQGCL